MARLFALPASEFGWLPQLVGRGSRFRLPADQWIATVPRLANVADQNYLDSGLTHLVENSGAPLISFDKRAVMEPGNFLNELLGGRPFPEWGDDEIRLAVQQYVSSPAGAAFWLDQVGEKIGHIHHSLQITQWNASPQYRTYQREVSRVLAQRGGRNFGGYDGDMSLIARYSNENPDVLRQALLNDTSALEVCRQSSPFGSDFFTGGYLYRDSSMYMYLNGSDDDLHRWVNAQMVALSVHAGGRRALQSNRWVCATMFPGFTQALVPYEWVVPYSRTLQDGATVTRSTFPLWTSSIQEGFIALVMFSRASMFFWEVENRVGSDERIAITGDTDTVYTGNVPRANAALHYTPDQAVGYPTQPEGGQDLIWRAGSMVAEAYAYAGQNHQFTASRNGRNGWSGTPGRDHLLDIYQQNRGYCRLGREGSRWWCYYLNTSLGAGEWETVEVNTQPGTFGFEAEGSTPYLWLSE